MIKHLVFIYLLIYFQICEAKDTILIVTEEWPPYNYTNKKGEIVGSSTEIIKKVMNKTDLDYKIEIYSWVKAYKIVTTQPNTLIYTIYRNPQRESSFKWICPLNNTHNLSFYSLKSSIDITVTKLDDVKNYLVGVVNQDVTFDYLVNNEFKVGKHLAIDSDEFANVRKLIKGRVDLIIQEEQALKFRLKRESLDFNKVQKVFTLFDKSLNNSCMAFNLHTPTHIIETVEKALHEVSMLNTSN